MNAQWQEAHANGKTVRVDSITGNGPHLTASGLTVVLVRQHASPGVYVFCETRAKELHLIYAGCAEMLPLSGDV